MKRLLTARGAAVSVAVLALLLAGGGYALASGGTIHACVTKSTHVLYTGTCKAGDKAISWLGTINGVAAGGALHGTYPNPSLATGSVHASNIAAGAVGPSAIAAGAVGPSAIAGIPAGRIDSSTSSLTANTDTLPCFPVPPANVGFLSGGMATGVTAYIASTCPAHQANEFVVPKTGAYLVTASVVMHDAGAVGANRYVYIRDGDVGSDGGTEAYGTSSSDGNTTLSTSAVMHLPAGDSVFLDVSSSSAESISGAGNTQFSIAWLGQ